VPQPRPHHEAAAREFEIERLRWSRAGALDPPARHFRTTQLSRPSRLGSKRSICAASLVTSSAFELF